MVDKINESVDIVIQLFDDDIDQNDDDDDDDDDLHNETNNSMCYYLNENKSNHSDRRKENQKEIFIHRILEYRLNARPVYSIKKKDIKIIRQLFKVHNRLLLKTYKSNAMYSCTINEFEEKTAKYIAQTNAYSRIEELNETNPNCVKNILDKLVEKTTTILDNLLQRQSISSVQYKEMKINRNQVRLDYLFFCQIHVT